MHQVKLQKHWYVSFFFFGSGNSHCFYFCMFFCNILHYSYLLNIIGNPNEQQIEGGSNPNEQNNQTNNNNNQNDIDNKEDVCSQNSVLLFFI